MSKTKSLWNKGDALLLDQYNGTNLGVIINEIILLVLNRFKWENLPPGLESRHIEKALIEHGQCAFFEHETGGICCLPCSPGNGYNIYGEPMGYHITGIGYSKLVNSGDVVRVLNNDTGLPTTPTILKYAGILNEIEITQAKNLKQQRKPFIIACTKDNELTMKNMYKQINDGKDAIFTDTKLTNGGDVGINILQTKVDYIINDLQEHKNNIINELLTKLGLNNSSANGNKKERLLVDEVNVNNGQILMYLDIEYKNRLKACEEINKKFGLNVTVKKVIDELSCDFIGHNKGVDLYKK